MCSAVNSNDLIPREVIFGNPDKANVQMNADGTFISYLSNVNGVLNIFIAKSTAKNNPKLITNDTGRGIRNYFWAYDGKHLLYLKDNDGDENTVIHRVNIDSLEDTILTPNKKVKANILGISYKFPKEIIISLNERKKEYFDIYKLNLATGKLSLVYQNNKYIGFNIDDNYNIRFGYLPTSDGGQTIYQFKEDNEVEFLKIPYKDSYTTGIAGFTKEKNKVYFMDSSQRDTSALYLMDLDTKSKQLIYANPKSDVNGVVLRPKERILEAVSYEYKREELYIVDEKFQKAYEHLKKINENADLVVKNRTLNDDKWLVAFVSDDNVAEYYLYNTDTQKSNFLFTNKKNLEGYNLTKMHPVVINSRDGLEMVSYLSLPLFKDKVAKPVPMVLLVHGGPNARDSWGFNETHQWLANRGYAVLSVNYRGSTGFGKNFINAGEGQWSAKMHDDLIDAVNWAIKSNITNKDNIAIMGGSYGGYAALVGLTFTPDVFACGIDIVGPSNLVTLLDSLPEYWKPLLDSMKLKLGGDSKTEEGRKILESKSPLFHVKKIIKPLLIGQGANDPRVKQAESDQIVEALKKEKIPVIYALYPDEGHGFARPENRLSFYAIVEEFLSKCLGGKYQPVGLDFKNSSIKIEAGKEFLSD